MTRLRFLSSAWLAPLCLGLAISVFVVSARNVSAAGCAIGPLNGECATSCNADQIQGDFFNAGDPTNFPMKTVCSGGTICCLSSGPALCSSVGAAAKGAPAGATWSCNKSCAADALLNAYTVGGLPETCGPG